MPRIAPSLKRLLPALLLAVAGTVLAADLEQSKNAGLVGETMEGYVGVVDASAPADVRAMVDDVNARRRVEYQRIADKNGLDLSQVEALAAKKAIEKTRPGDWVRLNGEWRRK